MIPESTVVTSIIPLHPLPSVDVKAKLIRRFSELSHLSIDTCDTRAALYSSDNTIENYVQTVKEVRRGRCSLYLAHTLSLVVFTDSI